MQDEKREIRPLSLLIAVCDKKNTKKVANLFKGKASLNLMMLGKGTASSNILNYLGLGRSKKTTFLSVMSMTEALDMLHRLDLALDLKRPGHGIAFTLPLDGACAKNFVNVPIEPMEERKECKMNNQSEYELIITVMNRGHDQNVMDAARTAKATGGTILSAKGFSFSSVEKFFGVTLQSNKEVILILAKSDRRHDIMEAIAEKAGPGTPTGAVSFSMAVSEVKGLQPYLPIE